MNSPLVSVFIPYYNDEKFLKTSIESVLNQSYQNFELILVNHASTDTSCEIARSYSDSRIKHIDMKCNLGVGGGGLLMTKFLDQACGKYVKFLCADDTLLDNGLRILVDYMENNPNIDFAFGNLNYINERGKLLGKDFFSNREYFSIDNTEADCIRLYSKGYSFLPYIGSIVKRDILSNIKINKTIIMTFDMSLWLSLLCKGYKIGYVEQLIGNYRIHKEQASAIQKRKQAEILSSHEWGIFWKIFLTIDSVDLAKAVWPESDMAEKLTRKEDIPFFVAYMLFDFGVISQGIYDYIASMFNDDEKRTYLIETFGFGIRELRAACLSKLQNNAVQKRSFVGKYKTKLYMKGVKDLSLFDMLYLAFRKFVNVITLRPLFKLFKKKNYSL